MTDCGSDEAKAKRRCLRAMACCGSDDAKAKRRRLKRRRGFHVRRPSPELCSDIILEILYRLPSKSLVRFKCVSKTWRRYIAGSSFQSCRSHRRKLSPGMIGFFYQYPEVYERQDVGFCFTSNKETSEKLCGQFDESLEFLKFNNKPPPIIISSSNGFLLCCDTRHHCMSYYVCNPATKQFVALPEPYQRHQHVAHGFYCNAKDVVDYCVIRLLMPKTHRVGGPETTCVHIENFSSVTGAWVHIVLQVDVPFRLWGIFRPAVIKDGVFLWLDFGRQIVACDGKENCWLVKFPTYTRTSDESLDHRHTCLSVHNGILYCGREALEVIEIWVLSGCIRSKDGYSWLRKYSVGIKSFAWQFLDYSRAIHAEFIGFHPDDPDIIYVEVQGHVLSYNFSSGIGELVSRPPRFNNFFAYEWHDWPRLLYSI